MPVARTMKELMAQRSRRSPNAAVEVQQRASFPRHRSSRTMVMGGKKSPIELAVVDRRSNNKTADTDDWMDMPFSFEAEAPPSLDPLPRTHVHCIQDAFGVDCDLYRDVLRADRNASQRELRIAYFRCGREVLAHKPSTDKLADLSNGTKLQFQAVSMAFEIVSNPKWKETYDSLGWTHVAAPQPPILRPSGASRSPDRPKIRWHEQVEELVFDQHPDEVRKEENETQRAVREARELGTQLDEKQGELSQNFVSGFLNDLEASLDGLEASFEEFASYMLEGDKAEERDATWTPKPRRQKKLPVPASPDDSSVVARELFGQLTRPMRVDVDRAEIEALEATTSPTDVISLVEDEEESTGESNKPIDLTEYPEPVNRWLTPKASNRKPKSQPPPKPEASTVPPRKDPPAPRPSTPKKELAGESVVPVTPSSAEFEDVALSNGPDEGDSVTSIEETRPKEDAPGTAAVRSPLQGFIRGRSNLISKSSTESYEDFPVLSKSASRALDIDHELDRIVGQVDAKHDSPRSAAPNHILNVSRDTDMSSLTDYRSLAPHEYVDQKVQDFLTSLQPLPEETAKNKNEPENLLAEEGSDEDFFSRLGTYMSALSTEIGTSLHGTNKFLQETIAIPTDDIGSMLRVLDCEFARSSTDQSAELKKSKTF